MVLVLGESCIEHCSLLGERVGAAGAKLVSPDARAVINSDLPLPCLEILRRAQGK